MTHQKSSRSTNPPYLGDYHRMRLYPRHWDVSSISGQNGVAHSSPQVEERAQAASSYADPSDTHLSPKAFDEWQISRHYPSDEPYRCDTFSAF